MQTSSIRSTVVIGAFGGMAIVTFVTDVIVASVLVFLVYSSSLLQKLWWLYVLVRVEDVAATRPVTVFRTAFIRSELKNFFKSSIVVVGLCIDAVISTNNVDRLSITWNVVCIKIGTCGRLLSSEQIIVQFTVKF